MIQYDGIDPVVVVRTLAPTAARKLATARLERLTRVQTEWDADLNAAGKKLVRTAIFSVLLDRKALELPTDVPAWWSEC